MDAFRLQATQWTNRLEGLLARHWPEVTELLSLRSKTLLMALKTYGSPAALAADPEATQRLYRWSGGSLKPKKTDCVLESARTTQGLPVGAAERRWIQEIATDGAPAEVFLTAFSLAQSLETAVGPSSAFADLQETAEVVATYAT